MSFCIRLLCLLPWYMPDTLLVYINIVDEDCRAYCAYGQSIFENFRATPLAHISLDTYIKNIYTYSPPLVNKY